MTTTYEEYLKLNIDDSRIGLEQRGSEGNYFCTPKGAQVIGWAGVDGIHFCFLPGFEDMVFVVSPTSTPGDYVHPVARTFTDFLRLLLACGDVSVLEQVHRLGETQFDVFLLSSPPTVQQQAVLDLIQQRLDLTPMPQPFGYIKRLQDEFDYSCIEFGRTYHELVLGEQPNVPQWKVYFEGSFWGHHGRERAGKGIPIDKQFIWGDEEWCIPAVYTCSKGLVVDFCAKVPAERIGSFMKKWNLPIQDDGIDFSDEERIQIETENPLAVDINPVILLNGTVVESSHNCGLSWNPCLAEGNGMEAKAVVEHYGLDPAYGWIIWRFAFPWPKKRKSQIMTLSVTLIKEPVAIQGPRFGVSAPGERVEFTHPNTNLKHVLTVKECERKRFPDEHFSSFDQEFPTHYIAMNYDLFPDLPDGAFAVIDCVPSDQSVTKETSSNKLPADNSVCIGIISGPDGPNAGIVGGSGQSRLRMVFSKLHFQPVEHVEWRMVFYEKDREDVTVKLI